MILGLLLSIAILLILLHQSPLPISASTYDVTRYGAKPDGKTDSSKALSDAWSDACRSSDQPTIHVPGGQFSISNNVHFVGNNNRFAITIEIEGILVARSGFSDDYLILLENVTGVIILGGALDGRGSDTWNCKRSGSHDCGVGATSLGITNSNNVEINGLKSYDSQFFHIAINGCNMVHLYNVTINAPENSTNTDGIHIQYSTNVTINGGGHIATGDDCVSIGPSTFDVLIEDIVCGPGHGISIGSLGWNSDEGGVENVTVKDVHFLQTTNGVRIKTWATTCEGYVKNVTFKGVEMTDVLNPILIDQHYCPRYDNCPTQESRVEISDITYEDINGTSASEIAVNFNCSPAKPCTGIIMGNIDLNYESGQARMSCSNAKGGVVSGEKVEPPSCLSN